MEQNSGESRSGEAMSIFGQSIDVRRPVRSRRRATQKVLKPSEFSILFYKLQASCFLPICTDAVVSDIDRVACRNFHLPSNHRRCPAWRGCTSAVPSRSESAPVPCPSCPGQVAWLPSMSSRYIMPIPGRGLPGRRSMERELAAAEGTSPPSTSRHPHPAPIRLRIRATRRTSR